MNNAPDTPKQRTLIVTTESGPVTIRRMRSKPARKFLEKIATHIAALEDLSAVINKLPELVLKVDELATELIVNSTDLNAEAIDEKLDIVEKLQVLEAAVKLNLGEDTKNSLAGIVDTVRALAPAMTTKTGE